MKMPKRSWFGGSKISFSRQPSPPSGEKPVSGDAPGIRVVNPDESLDVRPTAAWVFVAWIFAAAFILGLHLFFRWLPPYAHEIARNLKGFPPAWADIFLQSVEGFLIFAAVLSTTVHTVWRGTTRYGLSDDDLQIRTWVPVRRVEMIPLQMIRCVGFTQGVLGYLLDYGHVEIDLGGADGLRELRNCPKPEAFLKELQKRIIAKG